MTLNEFNGLDKAAAEELLRSCCGSNAWVSAMMKHFPFASEKKLVQLAVVAWYHECSEQDWLEAASHHPRIGDIKSLGEKFAGKEQEAVGSAAQETLNALLKANEDYEKKFGYLFIVCATGKTADEMLRLLNERLQNEQAEESIISMGEQLKITMIRLRKILPGADWSFMKPSQLTTHVLDTSIGKPGRNISIRLKTFRKASWQTIAQGLTNEDGRISDLLAPGMTLPPGNYKMVFDTGGYFAAQQLKGFYPEVDIQFTIADDSHYHVPLLINPFGYSTYRGS